MWKRYFKKIMALYIKYLIRELVAFKIRMFYLWLTQIRCYSALLLIGFGGGCEFYYCMREDDIITLNNHLEAYTWSLKLFNSLVDSPIEVFIRTFWLKGTFSWVGPRDSRLQSFAVPRLLSFMNFSFAPFFNI